MSGEALMQRMIEHPRIGRPAPLQPLRLFRLRAY
jgi:hypothetical protein